MRRCTQRGYLVLGPVVFGAFELRPAQRILLCDSERITLGTRAFDLLCTLVEHHDRVVNKDELMRQVWQGVVVEENNLTVHMSTLRKVLGTEAVTTVTGRGYRFTLPVMPACIAISTPQALSLPDKPSIAVLPLAHLAAEAVDDDVIDGITDELITQLSRFRTLFVISRNSVFTYKGHCVNVRTVARELGVRYVLEGSVHRSTASVRIAVQLIDALAGNQIWAERYDRQLNDVFALQEELASAIVAAMAPQIEISEIGRARSARVENVNAHHLALRAWARARDGLSRSNSGARDEAIALARQALGLDARCGAALNAIVDALSWHIYFDTAHNRAAALDEALDAAGQALALDNADHLAYRGRGWLMMVGCRLPEAISDLRRSLELNPNDAFTLARLGSCESISGNPAGGLEKCLWAMRLSPRDPERFHLLDNLVWAQFSCGLYLQAIDTARQSLREADFAGTRLCLVLCLVGSGDVAGAAAEFQQLQQRAPAMVAARLSGVWLASEPELVQRETAFLTAAQTHTMRGNAG